MIIVRDSAQSDFRAVQAIYAEHVLHALATFEEIPPTTEELLRATRTGFAPGSAVPGRRIQRHRARIQLRDQLSAACGTRYSIEDSVYVAPGHQRQGVGTLLLRTLIARCEAGPWRQMLAVIGDSANHRSIALHRRLGFKPVGTFAAAGFKFGRWVDSVLMQRPIGAGESTLPDPGRMRQPAPRARRAVRFVAPALVCFLGRLRRFRRRQAMGCRRSLRASVRHTSATCAISSPLR